MLETPSLDGVFCFPDHCIYRYLSPYGACLAWPKHQVA
ncbi:MAG: hypothetical protein OZSIB_1267 [Candidatus Ozemobacter sibiricus]|uniref:Uncharacterized protein n=1 Tax=Candidatus Ozemobacter sibiricus TaxID=2268124 RepID=A0A367ZKA0_9BACT|nr:MAG: hypothetical protein OZSIB_1267 [Candidatus Ozemobacter sibiricus]